MPRCQGDGVARDGALRVTRTTHAWRFHHSRLITPYHPRENVSCLRLDDLHLGNEVFIGRISCILP